MPSVLVQAGDSSPSGDRNQGGNHDCDDGKDPGEPLGPWRDGGGGDQEAGGHLEATRHGVPDHVRALKFSIFQISKMIQLKI